MIPDTDVYLIPGFAGSTLATQAGGVRGRELWASPVWVMSGEFSGIALAENGEDPHPDGGVQCFVTGGLEKYYLQWRVNLEQQAKDPKIPLGKIISWPWDWRKDGSKESDALVAEIIAEQKPARPCSIVSHSTGALIARLVWFKLGLRGKQNLVRRIVTIAGPHRGTYAIARMISGANNFVKDSVFKFNEIGTILIRRGIGPVFSLLTEQQFVFVFATFPASYALLPLLDARALVDDPFRFRLYNKGQWRTSDLISQKWLDWSKDTVGAFLRDPRSMPPPHILTTTGANGWNTTVAVSERGRIGDGGTFISSEEGDSTVPIDSAKVENSAYVQNRIWHADQPNVMSGSYVLTNLIIAERFPPDPPPPPVIDKTFVAPVLEGPPFGGNTFPESGTTKDFSSTGTLPPQLDP